MIGPLFRRIAVRQRRGGGGQLLIGIIIAVISIISFFASQEYNPVTGENQHVSLTPRQEIALGLQSAPELIQQFGGRYRDEEVQREVDNIGRSLVTNTFAADTPWQFEFHVLADEETVNAFALPGGQIFITAALLSRLETVDQVAGVLAHEAVHVLARHSSQQLAKNELTNGLIGAVAVASNDAGAAQTAAVIGQLVNMRYGREDEIQSDTLGVCLMLQAGYDPSAMADVMRILAEASGGQAPPEFFSTHPNPDNRIERIQEAVARAPAGCPQDPARQ
jgi:beta-barrel assembly-enhancing protease